MVLADHYRQEYKHGLYVEYSCRISVRNGLNIVRIANIILFRMLSLSLIAAWFATVFTLLSILNNVST